MADIRDKCNLFCTAHDSKDFYCDDSICLKRKAYIQGRTDIFDLMRPMCQHGHFTYDEDSHCSGYTYCMLKGFDYACSIENCEMLKEQK